MWNVPSPLTSFRTEHPRHLVALVAIALGLLALLVVPAMASAQTAAPAASPAAQEESPTAGEPAGAEEQGAATEADSTGTPSDEAAEPAPPPAATEPEPSPAPAPAPAGDPQPTAPLTAGGPDAAATPSSETAPETSQPIVLPAVPNLPDSTRATAPDRFEAALPAAPATPALAPVAPPTSPPDAPAATGRGAADPAAARPPPQPRSRLVEALGGVDRPAPDALAIGREIGPGAAGAEPDGANPFDTLAAPGGPAPAGSSLLAVLASYVLPGSGLPSTTLLLFIQLAVILAAFYAPRSGLGERIHALSQLGPRLGYRTVLARPG